MCDRLVIRTIAGIRCYIPVCRCVLGCEAVVIRCTLSRYCAMRVYIAVALQLYRGGAVDVSHMVMV